MKNFFKIFTIALAVFFVIIYIEERETLVYPLLGWVKPEALPAKEVISEIVLNFNKTLVEAYTKGENSNISGVDKALKDQIGVEIEFLKNKSWAFLPQFSRLDISDIKYEGDNIKVITSEDWNIRIFDHKKQEERLKYEAYKVTYTLERQGGDWLITMFYPEREEPSRLRVDS